MNNLFNALKVSFCRFFIDLTTFEKLSNLKRSKKINLKNLQILKNTLNLQHLSPNNCLTKPRFISTIIRYDYSNIIVLL
jgi:hypothetical protein